jgi:hypothetical protein
MKKIIGIILVGLAVYSLISNIFYSLKDGHKFPTDVLIIFFSFLGIGIWLIKAKSKASKEKKISKLANLKCEKCKEFYQFTEDAAIYCYSEERTDYDNDARGDYIYEGYEVKHVQAKKAGISEGMIEAIHKGEVGYWTCGKCHHEQGFPKGFPPTQGCYIATATYGNYNHPKVLVFRNFRDSTLDKNQLGRYAIKGYYLISPYLSKQIQNSSVLKSISRLLLDRIACFIKRNSP